MWDYYFFHYLPLFLKKGQNVEKIYLCNPDFILYIVLQENLLSLMHVKIFPKFHQNIYCTAHKLIRRRFVPDTSFGCSKRPILCIFKSIPGYFFGPYLEELPRHKRGWWHSRRCCLPELCLAAMWAHQLLTAQYSHHGWKQPAAEEGKESQRGNYW